MSLKIIKNSVFLFILCMVLSVDLHAHDAFSGNTTITVAENRELQVEMKFAAVTAEIWMSDALVRDKQISEGNQSNIQGHLLKKAKGFYQIEASGQPLPIKSQSLKIVNNDDAVYFNFVYSGLAEAESIRVTSHFIRQTNPEFRSTINVVNAAGEQLAVVIHGMEDNLSDISLKKQNQFFAVFSEFFVEGIHHIFIGFDHLVFLFSLLIVCHNWRSALLIISFFTLAHSITLALAALNIVNIPSSVVELLIALSIVYVGVENLITKHKPRFRWALTGLFGLVHGLGFASVLRDIGLGSTEAPLWVPLLAFNLGVETGQLILAAIFLPLFLYLRRYSWFEKPLLTYASIAVIVVGSYWAISRV